MHPKSTCRNQPPGKRAVLAVLLPLVCLAGVSCLERFADPEIPAGGLSSTVDRARPIVPGTPGQEGGLTWPFVNLFTGNFLLVVPMFRVPAIGPDWVWDFYYNSVLFDETTTLGPGWRHSYEIGLWIGVPDPSSITVRWGDGREDVFVWDGSGWASLPALHGMRIAEVALGYALRTKHGFLYEFNGEGRLTALRDRNANATVFVYDAAGRMTQIADASGRTCQLQYDDRGRLVSLTGLGHASSVVSCDYDIRDRLIRMERAGIACEFGYDAANRLVSATDPDGDAIAVDYRPLSNIVLAVRTADGQERHIDYNQGALETSVRDMTASGESVVRYRFDAEGRCVSVTDGPMGTTQNAYDAANNLVSHTDADGHTTAMSYSAEGDLLSVTDPLGFTRSYGYDPVHHLVLSRTNETGATWSGQRDGNGNLISWTDPLGNSQAFTYTPQGLLATRTDRRGNTTVYGYDANGNLSALTDPQGFTSSATYNPRGRPTTFTTREGRTYTMIWNERDEITSVALPGGESYAFSWNGSGTLAGMTDPRGAVTSWQYNDAKQVIGWTDPGGFNSSLVRDAAGFVIRAVNALGNATEYVRDLAGRAIEIRDPDGGLVSLVRGCCDILARTDALGTMFYSYSPRHEMVAAISGDGSVASHYIWDPAGNLLEASQIAPPDPVVRYTHGYDAAERLISVVAHHLGPRTTNFVLDPEGNPTNVQTIPNSAAINYVYDSRNQVVSVAGGAPVLIANLAYTSEERLEQINYSTGVSGVYGYDANGRLSQIHYGAPGFVANYNVGYDASGNRTFISSNLPPPLGPRNLDVQYELRRLPIQVNEIPEGGMTTIAYDAVRDRQQLVGPGGPVAYAYTPAQRMVTAGSTTLQWNQAGGCTEVSGQGGLTTFSYRADGALKTIVHNGQIWRILVGPLGEIARVDLPSGQSRWYAMDVADAGLLRREILASPGQWPLDSYSYVPGLGERAAAPSPVGISAAPIMWHGSPAGGLRRRATLTDPSGTVALVADGAGNLFSGRVYGLFGKLLAQTGSQHPAQGFLGMDVAEGLAAPQLLGLSTGGCGLSSVAPYLAETGSFLFDGSAGSDGLYAHSVGPPRAPGSDFWCPYQQGPPPKLEKADKWWLDPPAPPPPVRQLPPPAAIPNPEVCPDCPDPSRHHPPPPPPEEPSPRCFPPPSCGMGASGPTLLDRLFEAIGSLFR